LLGFIAAASAATFTFTLTAAGATSSWTPTNPTLTAGDTAHFVNGDSTSRTLKLTDALDNVLFDQVVAAGSFVDQVGVTVAAAPYTILAKIKSSTPGPARSSVTTDFFVQSAAAGAGDPHFVGFDNKRFMFQGQQNKNFALISDPWVEVNARMEKWSIGKTVISQACVRLHDHTVKLRVSQKNASLEVELDGKVARQDQNENGISLRFSGGQTNLSVSVPNWSFTFYAEQKAKGTYLNMDFKSEYQGEPRPYSVHGVMGHTLEGKPAVKDCNPTMQGDCEVVGKFQDYEVEDLCGTNWTYSQFVAKK